MNDGKRIFVACGTVLMVGLVVHLFCIYNQRSTIPPIVKTKNEMKQIAAIQKLNISEAQIQSAQMSSDIKTDAESIYQVARGQQALNKSDIAPIVGDLSNSQDKAPVILKQYHVYAAPKILREAGVKLNKEDKISGISFAVKKRINKEGKYIGARFDYDLKEKETAVWATYSW